MSLDPTATLDRRAAGPAVVSPLTRRQRRSAAVLDGPTPVWLGVVVVMAGFVLITFTWGKVAGLAEPQDQLPYVVSGGLGGVGLILVGLAVIDIATRRRDAAERTRQLDTLLTVVAEAGGTLDREQP